MPFVLLEEGGTRGNRHHLVLEKRKRKLRMKAKKKQGDYLTEKMEKG